MANYHCKPPPPGFQWVFTTRFVDWRSGKILEASDFGRDTWCFLVRVRSGDK